MFSTPTDLARISRDIVSFQLEETILLQCTFLQHYTFFYNSDHFHNHTTIRPTYIHAKKNQFRIKLSTIEKFS